MLPIPEAEVVEQVVIEKIIEVPLLPPVWLSWLLLGVALLVFLVALVALFRLRHRMHYLFAAAGLLAVARQVVVLFVPSCPGVPEMLLGASLLALGIGLYISMKDKMLKLFLRSR